MLDLRLKTEEKGVKIKIYLLSFVFCLLSCIFFFSSCDDTIEEQMPYALVNMQISLLDPNYNIPIDNGFRYIEGVGAKGILLYRVSSTNYLAFERCCTYKPQSQPCAIEVDASQLFIKDKCCNSFFKFDGTPYSGPAYRPLQQYSTTVVGNILYITN